jgi:protein-S-isoprenylcysteine O-methyltransferase Ste14
MQQKPIFMYPPVWLALGLGVQWVVDRYFPLMVWEPEALANTVSLVGKIIAVVAVLVVVTIAMQFKKADTEIKPYEESSALLTDGLYKYSRNPIYVMMVLVLVGFAMILGSLSPFAIVALFPVIIQKRFIVVEEAMMEEKFGDEYRDFKSAVRRWI